MAAVDRRRCAARRARCGSWPSTARHPAPPRPPGQRGAAGDPGLGPGPADGAGRGDHAHAGGRLRARRGLPGHRGADRRRGRRSSRSATAPTSSDEQQYNVVTVELRRPFDASRLQRNFYETSSCGVCGKASIEAGARCSAASLDRGPAVRRETCSRLPGPAARAQAVFESTGGLHAAGLFRADGELLVLREDVGRHNAMDKLVGERCWTGGCRSPGRSCWCRGRASFELVQKAAVAGIAVLCAVSAPSSLAVETAREPARRWSASCVASASTSTSRPERVALDEGLMPLPHPPTASSLDLLVLGARQRGSALTAGGALLLLACVLPPRAGWRVACARGSRRPAAAAWPPTRRWPAGCSPRSAAGSLPGGACALGRAFAMRQALSAPGRVRSAPPSSWGGVG